jgi:hypothetical protein
MNDQLETNLREVFAWRASEVSTDAVERLRRMDYRPHMRRRWPLTVSALGAASGTAAIVSVVVLGGSQPVFAGWSATPVAPAQVHTAATLSDCQSQLASAPGAGDGSWNQVATDVRGPYTMAVYENGKDLASCFTGPSFTTVEAEQMVDGGGMAVSVSGTSSGTASSGTPPTPSSTGSQLFSATDIDQLLITHQSQAENGPYTLALGRLDASVSAVTLDLSDGQDVTATTGSGWLVAWWPGGANVTAAQVTTASDTTTESISQLSFPHPPAGSGTAVHVGSGGVPGPSTNASTNAQSGSMSPAPSPGTTP